MFPSVAAPYAPEPDAPERDAAEPPPTLADTPPSGVFAAELDFATGHPAALSDAELVDAVVGYERLAAWAAARQAAVLAEFAARPADHPSVPAAEVRQWAADEIALATTVSRGSAHARIARAVRLDGVLRPTRDLLETGQLDPSRARLICDRVEHLDDDLAAAVQHRVLTRAAGQTWAQLDAALRRAILAVDTDGATTRHRSAKQARRVDVFPGEDGMATLWARMPAPDAAASFEWLTRLARGMGATDPRTLDQRRTDLLVAALTGKLVLRDPNTEPGEATATLPVTPGKPLITVIVPYSTLTGADDQPCELSGYGPIPAHLARDIATDAVWRRLLVDPASGTLLDYGRTVYR
ncbi:DUF222 domain-containing protein, partial [Pseudonocardia sp.]|uniref:DUF222 domain-containing protein n=1 Tax=Pseudonocardia sp. TaxID=60912 RepID=UPI002623FC0C